MNDAVVALSALPVVLSALALVAYAMHKRAESRRVVRMTRARSWLHPSVGSRAAYLAVPGVDGVRVAAANRVVVEVAWWAKKSEVRAWLDDVRPVHVSLELRRSLL